MINKLISQLRVHKYIFYGIILVLTILQCLFLKLLLQSTDGLSAWAVVVLFAIMILFIFLVASVDRYSQPYLIVFSWLLGLVPYVNFVSIVLPTYFVYSKLVNNLIYSCLIVVGFNTISVVLYAILTRKANAVTEEQLKTAIMTKFVSLSPQDMQYISSKSKFVKWNTTGLIFIVLCVGRYLVNVQIAFIAMITAIFAYCMFAYRKIYKIKCKSNTKLVMCIALDSCIYFAFSIFAILLSYNVIEIYFIDGKVNQLEIASLVAFGLVPFIKLSSFAYFGLKNTRLKEQLTDEQHNANSDIVY